MDAAELEVADVPILYVFPLPVWLYNNNNNNNNKKKE
jgi:hypothetical protein